MTTKLSKKVTVSCAALVLYLGLGATFLGQSVNAMYNPDEPVEKGNEMQVMIMSAEEGEATTKSLPVEGEVVEAELFSIPEDGEVTNIDGEEVRTISATVDEGEATTTSVEKEVRTVSAEDEVEEGKVVSDTSVEVDKKSEEAKDVEEDNDILILSIIAGVLLIGLVVLGIVRAKK